MIQTNLTGIGDVFYGEERVATVHYQLAPTPRTGRAAGMDGVVAVIEGDPLAMTPRNYILRLDDHREVAFFVTELPDQSSNSRYAVGTTGPIMERTRPTDAPPREG